MTAPSNQAQSLYRAGSSSVRASFGEDCARALGYYAALLDFVSGVCPPNAPDALGAPGVSDAAAAAPVRLLDVGCGSGWSTFAFASAGYEATGVDLNPQAFEPPPHARCALREGSATDLPLPDEAFDAVVCYQCLEHVPDPRRALDEMVRVCRLGGVVAVVGPNLVSPLPGLAYAVQPKSWKSIPLRRRPGMARHSYGNTLPEILGSAVMRSAQLIGKLARRSPRFLMREPDDVPPFHADNDACYLCNPTDLIAYFQTRGLRVERRGKPGRWPGAYLLAGGTWVAARKLGGAAF